MPRSKKPVSEKQLAANRANAARSTGPQTPQGKARSAQNSRKHGFAAADYGVVRMDDLQAVANLKADLVEVYRPVNAQELFAIERIALAQLAILRAARLEAGLFTSCLNQLLSGYPEDHFIPMSDALIGDIEVTRAQNRNYALAEGFSRLAGQSNAWSLFLRYQAQVERHYRRAIEDFERLKALRHELPNEPISEDRPEQATPEQPAAAPPPEPAPPGVTGLPVANRPPSPPAPSPRSGPPRESPRA